MRRRVLYVLVLLLFITHQVEAAWWHEWEMFGLPGGIQLFLILNGLFMLPFVAGVDILARGARGSRGLCISLGLIGIAGFLVHGGYLLAGDPCFRLPSSYLTFAGIALASPMLIFEAARKD